MCHQNPSISLGTFDLSKVLGQGMVWGCSLRNAVGRASESPGAALAVGRAAGAAVLCHNCPQNTKRVAGSVSSPGQTNCPSPRWERRAWRREGSSCGNVSLSRMRKPLLLSVLPCVLSVTRRGSAGTELLCHLPGAPVSAPGRNKPKER